MKSEIEAILRTHHTFYVAFSGGNFPTMEACWAKDNPVLAIHPWGPVIVGRDDVMRSWKEVLRNPPNIQCTDEHVEQVDDFAIVTCLERAGEGILAATNILVKENESWLFCHHHAGPLAPVFSTPRKAVH